MLPQFPVSREGAFSAAVGGGGWGGGTGGSGKEGRGLIRG